MIIYNINKRMFETYKTIDGFENYSVSDHGNVRNTFSGKILKPDLSRGYLRVCLMQNKTRRTKSVHKLTAEAFLANPEDEI